MGKKLVGLLKSSTGMIHGLKEKEQRIAYSGYQDKANDSISYSGRSHINCQKCLKKLPEEIY